MGYEVDTEQVLRCSGRLKQVEQHAAGIMRLAEDADPEWYIWGVVGAPFAAVYWALADEVYASLGQLGVALRDRVTALDTCADNYASQEAAVVDALKGIEELLT